MEYRLEFSVFAAAWSFAGLKILHEPVLLLLLRSFPFLCGLCSVFCCLHLQ